MDYAWFFIIFIIVVVLAYFGTRKSAPAVPAGPVEGKGEFDIVPTADGGDDEPGESWP